MPRSFIRILSDVQSELGITGDQTVAMQHMNNAFRFVWDAFEWKETLEDLPEFFLIPGWHIYRSPNIVIPTDFADLYSAEVVTVNSEGLQSSDEMKVIRNLEDNQILARTPYPVIGYSSKHLAFLVANIAPAVVGYKYIKAKYKKDYLYDLTTASNAANAFPLPRHEGLFSVVLKWFIRGQPEQDFGRISALIASARQSEHPGMQDFVQAPTAWFGDMGIN